MANKPLTYCALAIALIEIERLITTEPATRIDFQRAGWRSSTRTDIFDEAKHRAPFYYFAGCTVI